MLTGAFSVMGSYHDKNQDSYLTWNFDFGDLIVTSDGVGSCRFSELGSMCACTAVRRALEFFRGIPNDTDMLFQKIQDEWITLITAYGSDISCCYATLLFCFVSAETVFAARLGDGFIGIKNGGETTILFDNKADRMINETDSLYEEFCPEAWEAVSIETDCFSGAVCCSDGISITPAEIDNYSEFLSDFIDEYCGMSTAEIINQIGVWLPTWDSCDDKTIAFMIKEKI